MPRFSTRIVDPATGEVIGVACGSYRRKRCSHCAVIGAELECDGCDKALCKTCAVSPRAGLDFCPRCFDRAWKHWLKLQPKSSGELSRYAKRAAFRAWAKLASETFLGLTRPLTATAVQSRAR